MPHPPMGDLGAYSVKRLCTTGCKPYLAQPMPMRRVMRGAPAGAISPGWGLQRLARTIVFYDIVGRFWGECEPKSVQLTPQRLAAGRPSLSLRTPGGARTAGCSGTGAELQRPARAIVFHDGQRAWALAQRQPGGVPLAAAGASHPVRGLLWGRTSPTPSVRLRTSPPGR